MSVFDINFSVLGKQLLPVRLRNDKMLAWIKCLVRPVGELHNVFKADRTANLYQLAHNSQIVYLQAALNDLFDPAIRGIVIVDGAFEDPLFIYLPAEDEPLWLGLTGESTTYPNPRALYTDTETTLLGNCFIVKVPVAVSFDMARMRAIIDKYRLAGKNTYAVVTY
ncbi:MAG: hypothetical protein V4649_04505 [Bacteroidota bacterium]